MKRQLVALVAIVVLAVAAVLLGRSPGAPERQAGAPANGAIGRYDPDQRPREVVYREEGGFGPFERLEIAIGDEPVAVVRYKLHGAREVERRQPLTREQVVELFARFEKVDFFRVEESPRGRYIADHPAVTLSLRTGASTHQVRSTGKLRPTHDIQELLAFFGDVKKAVTPEPIATGD